MIPPRRCAGPCGSPPTRQSSPAETSLHFLKLANFSDTVRGMTDLASLSSLDDPVRRRLYEAVRERTEPVGRAEAAAAAGVGRALAVYHLDKLVEAGLLTASYQRPPGRSGPGAGRPAKLYMRSDREFAVTVPPREYELAARLLVQAVEADPGGNSRAALLKAARRLGTELGGASRSGQDVPRQDVPGQDIEGAL